MSSQPSIANSNPAAKSKSAATFKPFAISRNFMNPNEFIFHGWICYSLPNVSPDARCKGKPPLHLDLVPQNWVKSGI